MELNLQHPLTLGLILVLLTIGATPTLASKRDDRFSIHPPAYAYLDCSACLAFTVHLGERMNDSLKFSAGGSASVLTTHRLDEDNKLKRRDFASSELRAAEVLERICSDALEENYVLRLDVDRNIRVYKSGASTLPFAQHYSLQDARTIKDLSKHAVRTFCQRAMSEEEEAMTSLVRELRSFYDVQWRLCGGDDEVNSSAPPEGFTESITNACVDTDTSVQLEIGRMERYKEWQVSISRKRDDAVQEIPESERKPIVAVPVTDASETGPAPPKPTENIKLEDLYFDDLDL